METDNVGFAGGAVYSNVLVANAVAKGSFPLLLLMLAKGEKARDPIPEGPIEQPALSFPVVRFLIGGGGLKERKKGYLLPVVPEMTSIGDAGS